MKMKMSLPLVLLLMSPGVVVCWPMGMFGLPATREGCPSGTNWKTGARIQHTAAGSHSSKDSHFAGVIHDDRVEQHFCMKTDPEKHGDYVWQPGQYCIYKKGQCPPGFKQGFIIWDDKDKFPIIGKKTFTSSEGVLPDGKYDENTKVEYCCRTDGPASKPIHLPMDTSFYLLKKGHACQTVEGTEMKEEWVFWSQVSFLTWSAQGGSYPTSTHIRGDKPYIKVYYCFYTPRGGFPKAAIIAIAVIGGVLAAALFLYIVAKFIFYCHKEKEEYERDNDNAVELEPMNRGASAAPIVTADSVPTKPPLPGPDQHESRVLLSAGGATGPPPAHLQPTGVMPPPPGPEEQPPSYSDVLKEDGKV